MQGFLRLKLIVLVPAVVGVAFSQTDLSRLPSFEVASIKPHKAGDSLVQLPKFLPGGKFIVAGMPLQDVIAFAYQVPIRSMQLSGGPDWIRSLESAYDIEAQAQRSDVNGSDDPEAQRDKLRLMLQALLADRFRLVIRHEIKQEQVYTLTVSKNGPRLQKSKLEPRDCDDPANRCHYGGIGQSRGIHVKAYTIGDLIIAVSNFSDRPIIDRTGLMGLYDVDTGPWVPLRPRPVRPPGAILTRGQAAEDRVLSDPTLPTLFMIFDGLGLKMESSTANEDVLFVEHVEKPSEN